jgi:hypothetical protein
MPVHFHESRIIKQAIHDNNSNKNNNDQLFLFGLELELNKIKTAWDPSDNNTNTNNIRTNNKTNANDNEIIKIKSPGLFINFKPGYVLIGINDIELSIPPQMEREMETTGNDDFHNNAKTKMNTSATRTRATTTMTIQNIYNMLHEIDNGNEVVLKAVSWDRVRGRDRGRSRERDGNRDRGKGMTEKQMQRYADAKCAHCVPCEGCTMCECCTIQ